MDYVEGRGISNGNDVYFIFDAENDVVVMATYRDAPGVRSDLLQPNIIKTFSKDEWGDINEFLSAGANQYEEDEEEKPDISPDDEVEVPPVTSSLPAMSGTLPEPVEDDRKEIEEKGDEELADATMREEKENGEE